MSVQFVGAMNKMGPVGIAANTIVARGDLIRLVNGLVVPVVDATVANMAVALELNPDGDYEGTKTQVDLAYLGEDQEVEMPFVDVGGGIAVADIGVSYNILALNGGTVNLDAVNAPAFVVRRFGQGVAVGAATGTVIGVFLDAVSL
jgi:hypothetical protein